MNNNNNKEITIPATYYNKWELEAALQRVSVHGLKSFIKMKEDRYIDNINNDNDSDNGGGADSIYANKEFNKLSKTGTAAALAYFHNMHPVQRTCTLARLDLLELKEIKDKGSELFFHYLNHFYKKLKNDMKELRIKKETMLLYNFDYKDATNFYYSYIKK